MHCKFNSFIHMTLLNNYVSMYHRQRDHHSLPDCSLSKLN